MSAPELEGWINHVYRNRPHKRAVEEIIRTTWEACEKHSAARIAELEGEVNELRAGKNLTQLERK